MNDVSESKNRILFIDGLRGIAILLVVLFHAYVRWPELVPYGARYAAVPVVNCGWLGVYLFFIISGFVIMMTLEKTPNFCQFLYRRWLRLFPAMMVISVLVYITAYPFFPERPGGIPVLRDLIPGLTFINEFIWGQYVFHSPQGMIEWAFWSLFVEVEFYVLFGMMYYVFGSHMAIAGILWLFLFDVLVVPGLWRFPFVKYLGWFAVGALFCRYYMSLRKQWLVMGFLCAFACIFLSIRDTQTRVIAGILVGLFTYSMISTRMQKAISQKWLLFFGFISYPLYLVHCSPISVEF